MWLILTFVLLSLVLYNLLLRPFKLWKNKRIKHEKPIVFFGNFLGSALARVPVAELIQRVYNKFKDERYCGFYQFSRPFLMIRDPELIKRIAVKDFDKFQDHQAFSAEDIDPLWSKNLFSTKGAKWRALRPAISPSFTSSKMKAMFVLIEECADQFTKYFLEQKDDVLTVDMKDMFTRYTNDVIATCAFGVTCDSLKERDNEFYLKGLEATDFTGLNAFKFFGYVVSPALMKLFRVKIISNSTGNFFRKLIGDSIKLRQEKNIVRPDVIQLLLEAKKESKHNVIITEEDITAQTLIFFLAGFDTSSTLMVFMAYELAVNKDIQDWLYSEIKTALEENNGKISYDVLFKMKYLDMIVSETLRKWPPSPITDRVCNEDYVVAPELPTESAITIDKGSMVWFPTFALHRDPKHFENPLKFDPERFSDANKDKINPYANIPFGVGPRICIGSRFALMETKALMVKVLEHFEIVPVKETQIPLKLSPKHFNLFPENGMKLGLKRRLI